MASDTRDFDVAALGRLEALIASAGGRQQLAARMAVANGKPAPSKEEVESQALRLKRILKSRRATMKSLNVVAAALEKPVSELLSLLFEPPIPAAAAAATRSDRGQDREAEKSASRWRAPETETGRLYQRLNRASEVTATRTNTVRDESELPVLTLQDQLYVRRDIEDEIARALERRTSEAPFVVIDGEAGTGKSSVLWATTRMLKATGADAWLVDAIELPSIFGPGRDGTILSEPLRELFRSLTAEGGTPVLLIDTIDVPLNRNGADVYITSLITELAMADVTVVAASRPGEARMLSGHQPYTIFLFDYSDAEFPRAVAAYANAYVRDGETLTPEAHAERVLEAAAQGYPIKEICRNPLTLRMLYAIYAPQEINFRDVDVITLFREFWRRRVESDLRTGAKTAGVDQTDLSDAAMRIAIAMLVAGAPELPKDRLARELQAAGLGRSGLEQLHGRGVVRVSHLSPDYLVGFFHQTFFEHAAALAIIRLGGPQAITALAERWAKYDGNLFLGAVLERVLVLSEYEPAPVEQAAERVMGALAGPSGKSVSAYLFVHRRSVPAALAEEIRARVAAGDTLTVERILAIGANAARSRRVALIETLGTILRTESSRWVRRALELLLRFASPDLPQVRQVARDAQLGRIILKGADRHMQSRELYLRFLALSATDDLDWSLAEFGRFLSDALKRQSDRSCLDVLETAAGLLVSAPRLVRQLETLAGLDRPNIAKRITSESVAQKMGNLYFACWQSEGTTIEQAIDETVKKSGLAMLGRLHALGIMILATTPRLAARAFELTGNIADTTVRVMAARITWTRCLPAMIKDWPADEVETVTRHARELAHNVLGAKRNGHADILYHVVRHGDLTNALAHHLLDEAALVGADPWLQTRVLGHRLIRGVAAGIEGAQAAFAMLTRAPAEYEVLARGALAQIKASPVSGETQAIALRLAVVTKNAEAALDILRQSQTIDPECGSLVPTLRQTAERLWRTGNPKSMRLGSGLAFELVRLQADPNLGWGLIVARAQSEKDDLSMAQLVRALCLMAARDSSAMKTRMRWLLDFAKNKGPSTREAVLALYSDASEHDATAASEEIEDLFDLAFTEPTDGSLIEKLQAPLFNLYRNKDPRALTFAKALIDRSAPLSPQTCHRVCGTFKRLFGLIVERMDQEENDQLLSKVPGLHRRLGRMIVEGAARAGGEGLAARLKAIAENPKTDPEIVTLAGRFLHRELRVSGLERWPELYDLVASR
jgi:hypothetical protein